MKKVLATLAFVALTATAAHAQILSWDMSGQTGSQATQTAGTINFVTGGVLSRVDVLPAALANSFNSTNWNTTATRVDGTNYITFSLQPTAGNTITLTDLQFAINGTNTAPNQGIWGYSINGGSFVLGTGGDGGAFTLTNPVPSGLATWNFSDFSLTSTDTAEFRFWAFGTTAINSTNPAATGGAVRVANVAGDDLVLNGAFVIPEPSTLGLIGLGLVGVVAFAHRRWRKVS